ncbi:MAG: hypothetical protein ACI8VT_000338 [Saprospiraceae bacterium]
MNKNTKPLIKNHLLLIFAFLILAPFSVRAQVKEFVTEKIPTASQYKEITKYKTWVHLNNKKLIKGYLYRVTNDEIILLSGHLKDYFHFVELVRGHKIKIETSSIKKIKTRKKERLRNGILIGSGIGLTLGLIVGTLQSNSEFGVQTGPFTSVATILGGSIGALFSKSKKSYNLKNAASLEELKKKSIMFAFEQQVLLEKNN